MTKWLTRAARAVHVLVPYAALGLTLVGQPECAAALRSAVGVLQPVVATVAS